MYSFQPLADIPVSHGGLFMICMLCLTIFVMSIMSEDIQYACVVFVFFCVPLLCITYGVSYHWTSQEPQVFKNEKVTAEFVSFQPEGYRESSGKSKVDKHYMYVVYSVNGSPVILQAQPGQTYPKSVILYKN